MTYVWLYCIELLFNLLFIWFYHAFIISEHTFYWIKTIYTKYKTYVKYRYGNFIPYKYDMYLNSYIISCVNKLYGPCFIKIITHKILFSFPHISLLFLGGKDRFLNCQYNFPSNIPFSFIKIKIYIKGIASTNKAYKHNRRVGK